MVMCFAPDCKHYSEKDTCKFFRFPKDINKKKRWVKAIRRADREPSEHSLVCSCHFVDAAKENGPTIFPRNEKKILNFPDVEPSRKKKLRTEAEAELEADGNELEAAPPLQTEAIPPSTSRSKSNSEVALEAEIYLLKKEIEELKKKQTVLQRFNFEMIRTSNELIIIHTGLPNKEIFEYLLELCTARDFKYFSGWAVTVINNCDQLLMTLMKLKQNVPHKELAFRFQVSRSTVSNILSTWIHVLHATIFEGIMKNNIPSIVKNQACLPNCFSDFTSCRIIIDCTEVFAAVPAGMGKKQCLYSNYKHRYTLKGLVGVAPNGVVTFLSELYGGSTSDKKITQDCGLLSQLKPGDVVLADKGFLISDIVPEGVLVNIPPFLETPQFTSDQAIRTRCIARARIHVERAIGRIKGYSILEYIPHTLMPYSSKVWQVCGALSNFQYPLIREVEVFYRSGENVE